MITTPGWQPAYTFDDVTLEPSASDVLPSQVDIKVNLTDSLSLAIPIIASAMDTVSEYKMAIAMAQLGGLAVIHRNMTLERQIDEVRSIKKYESGMVVDPITIRPEQKLVDALNLMKTNNISGIPVTNNKDILQGILTNRDVRFATNHNVSIGSIMTKENLITVKATIKQSDAKRLLHKHRIEKLLVVDERNKCIGLITVKDIERAKLYPNATKDDSGRLIAAAAVGCNDLTDQHCENLIEVGCDVLVIDTAHGHSKQVLEQVKKLKQRFGKSCILIAGNVATPEGVEALVEAGAQIVKIGIGPGSICTTRMIAGVGIPQLTAIYESTKTCKKLGITSIADGGIRYSGDMVKALSAGADAIMIGSLLAGTDESPGEVFIFQGRSYKSYRGMGSIAAMAQGSADRYFQDDIKTSAKYVPEGVEGRVDYRGPVSNIIDQLKGGIKAGMGYTGSKTLKDLRKAKFRLITSTGLAESHVHNISVTREAPNYQTRIL